MREVDAAILARVGDPIEGKDDAFFSPEVGVTVYGGWFDARAAEGEVVVDYPVPYANYLSSFGDDDQPRLSGLYGQREKYFRFYVVGLTLEQTQWAVGQLRARMDGFRPEVEGIRFSRVRLDSSPLIVRDDDALRPDGRKSMFYAVDGYTLRMSVRRTAPLAP